jgi:hypothetical protein
MSDVLDRLDEINERLSRDTRILLIFVRGRITDENGDERWDDVDMGWVTHVPSKGETVRLEGKLYGVTRVHYNAERMSAAGGSILYAFAHLGLSTEDPDEDRWPRSGPGAVLSFNRNEK